MKIEDLLAMPPGTILLCDTVGHWTIAVAIGLSVGFLMGWLYCSLILASHGDKGQREDW
jgi:hypothetical protein